MTQEGQSPKAVIRLSGNQVGQVSPPNAPDPVPEEVRKVQAQGTGIPLPVGAVVVADRLSPLESEMYSELGVQSGDKIPANFPEIVDTVKQQVIERANIPQVGVDPRHQPVKPDVKDIRDLPPEQQKEIKETLRQAIADFQASPPSQKRKINPATMAPGVAKAVQTAQGFGNQVKLDPSPRGVEAGNPQWGQGGVVHPPGHGPGAPQTAQEPSVRPQVQAAPEPEKAPETTNQAAQAPEPAYEPAPETDQDRTGNHPELHNCPYCQFDLTQPPFWEKPSKDDVQAFMVAMLGQQPYTRVFPLMNGQISIEFRTLTFDERDLIYRQIYLEREAGEIHTAEGFWEQLGRYQLYLQLRRVRFGENPIVLPEHVSAWEVDNLPEGTTPLPLIAKWIRENVLTTEPLHRLAAQQCSAFNALEVRLEALTQDPDFWKETAG